WFFEGVVTDASGNSIPNATITITIGDQGSVDGPTDDAGSYDFEVDGTSENPSENVTVCASADNYIQQCGSANTITSAAATLPQDFVLQSDGEGGDNGNGNGNGNDNGPQG